MTLDLTRPAVFSDDGKYRYFLSRQWAKDGKRVAFIGLNPSTADDKLDDPTIRRCIGFAKSWGGCSLWMVNLFAFRSTKPAILKSVPNPIGDLTDEWINTVVRESDIAVAAWGNYGSYLNRADEVLNRHGKKLTALALTKGGMPGHPLYLRGETRPFALSHTDPGH